MKTSELSGYGMSVIFLALTAFAASPARAEESVAAANPAPKSTLSFRGSLVSGAYHVGNKSGSLDGAQGEAEYRWNDAHGQGGFTGNLRYGEVGDKTVGAFELSSVVRKPNATFGLAWGAMRTTADPTMWRIVAVEAGPAVINQGKHVKGHTAIQAGLPVAFSRIEAPKDSSQVSSADGYMLAAVTDQNIANIVKIKGRVEKGNLDGGEYSVVGGSVLGQLGSFELGTSAVYNQMRTRYKADDTGAEFDRNQSEVQVLLTAGGVF